MVVSTWQLAVWSTTMEGIHSCTEVRVIDAKIQTTVTVLRFSESHSVASQILYRLLNAIHC